MPEQQVEQPANWLEEAAAKPEEKLVEEAKSEPEQTESEAEQPEAKEKVEKVVPLGALHESRAKEREARREAQAVRAEMEQMRRQQLEWMAKQGQPQPATAPDPKQDPIGALVHNQSLTQQQLAEMRQQQTLADQRAAQQQQYNNFVATVRAKNDEYVKERPDANDAINFLKSNRVEEYKAMGMSAQEATQRMLHDEVQLSQWALQNGENPAAVACRMAESRGYTAPEKKLEMQAKGQKASMPSGGGKGGGLPSLDALLQMDSKDFQKATEGDNWAKLMKRHGA